jgi:hypothetical protein
VGTDAGRVAGMEQARGSGAKFRRKYHLRVEARCHSDGHQILSDGRYGADEETRGDGEMNGASRTRRRRSEPAGLPETDAARGGA